MLFSFSIAILRVERAKNGCKMICDFWTNFVNIFKSISKPEFYQVSAISRYEELRFLLLNVLKMCKRPVIFSYPSNLMFTFESKNQVTYEDLFRHVISFVSSHCVASCCNFSSNLLPFFPSKVLSNPCFLGIVTFLLSWHRGPCQESKAHGKCW